MNPDCRDGKHASCSGDGWDMFTDLPCACPCSCHAVVEGQVVVEGQRIRWPMHPACSELNRHAECTLEALDMESLQRVVCGCDCHMPMHDEHVHVAPGLGYWGAVQ